MVQFWHCWNRVVFPGIDEENNTPSSPAKNLRRNDASRSFSVFLLSLGLISCVVVYTFLSIILRPDGNYWDADFDPSISIEETENGQCCQGIENLELWGAAVKWGSEFKFNSSKECCAACKAMCTGNDGPCLCDTWVFCGNKKACGSRFGEVSGKFAAFLSINL